ncbi:MAG TPA: DUF2946 family protein [Caulobacteraceae bacterium]|nr:DUF2946 family protein [Caulobacteraceae bacterium]
MRGLGRLLALPWLLIALAVQSLAPAEAAAMRPDPAGMGICSAHELGGGSHRPDPAKGHDHDCCAFACAVSHLAAVPPAHAFAAHVAFAAAAGLVAARCDDAPSPSPIARPRARAPPLSVQTI